MNQQNPFSVPSTFGEVAVEPITQQVFGGIGRLAYFGYSFLNSFLSQVLTVAVVAALPTDAAPVAFIIPLLSIAAGIAIVLLRLKNLGYSGWWLLGLIVPILNLVVGIRLIAAPEGYAVHKTLDGPGKVIVGLVIGAFLLLVAVVVLAAMR
ncbi:MAG: DUF805 domain-containing protein [Planctomycetota bacterium]